MSEDDRLDELLRHASHGLERPSRDLLAGAEAVKRRRRRKLVVLRVGVGAVAAAMLLAASILRNAPEEARLAESPVAASAPRTERENEASTSEKTSSFSSASAATVKGGNDTLVLQVPTRSPRVHFFWVYPAWRPEGKTQAVRNGEVEKGGRS